MDQIQKEIAAFFSKIWVWILYILLGYSTKYSIDLLMGRKVTRRQALGAFGVAIGLGILGSAFCVVFHYEKIGIFLVTPIAMFSEKIAIAIMAMDFKKGFLKELVFLLRRWANKINRYVSGK